MSSLAANPKDRRGDRRRPPRGAIRIVCLKGALGLGKNLAVSLLDLSETGVRLIVNSALNPRQEIEVSVAATSQSRPIKALADVVWCVPAADGTFCVGARFQKRLRYQDFQSVCM